MSDATEPAPPAKRRERYVARTLAIDIAELMTFDDENCRYLIDAMPMSRANDNDEALALQAWLYMAGTLRGANTPSILGGWGAMTTWRKGITINVFDPVMP